MGYSLGRRETQVNAVGHRIRVIRTYDDVGGDARHDVSTGLAGVYDCNQPLAIYIFHYTRNL